jgi:GNAT superfamily N-acetyltransferase
MRTVMSTEHKVLAFLTRDTLRHVVHLKMLHAYPDATRCYYHEDGAATGVLVLLDTLASPYDAQTYPSARYVVLPAATSGAAALALLRYVPADCGLVFKLIDRWTKAVVIERYRPARERAYLSYTSGDRGFSRAPSVRISERLEERCLPLFAANGYSAEEMRTYFAKGAFSLAIDDPSGQEGPVAACFCFPNYRQVWEIAGVRTVEGHRRQGYARKVVETALSVLADRGCIPRYQMHEDNEPSIRLAESIGLERFLVTEHFTYGT